MEELLIKINQHLKGRHLTYKFFVACDGTTFFLFYQNTFAPADGFEKVSELAVNTNPTENHLIAWVNNEIDNPEWCRNGKEVHN